MFHKSLIITFITSGIILAQSSILHFQLSDTTTIILADSIMSVRLNDNSDKTVYISQEKKWFLIPIDHYYMTDISIQSAIEQSAGDSIPDGYRLIIDNLTYWNDDNLLFSKGPVLNAYTRLTDENNRTVADWQWEYRPKKRRKDKTEGVIKDALIKWMNDQKSDLPNYKKDSLISPFRYRRNLTVWTDLVLLSDGIIIESRIGLNFPADEKSRYTQSTLGIFYRKSSTYESVAIGGKNQYWYYRYNSNWCVRLNINNRIGFNRFNPEKYKMVYWGNIVLINTGLTASIEYRPRYLKGIFAGVGLHENINLFPTNISRFETGILLTAGFNLP